MPSVPERERPDSRSVLLAILTVIAVAVALKLAASVLLPVVFAVFLIAVLWPVYRLLERRIPRGFAALGTLLVFLAFVGAVGAGLWYNVEVFSERSQQYFDEFRQMASSASAWMNKNDIGDVGGGNLDSLALGALRQLGTSVGGVLGGFVLVVAFLVLGVLEVRDYQARLQQGMALRDPQRWQEVARRVAHDFQKYVVVRTGIGLLTGALVTLGSWIVGLDFPFVWGMLNFLLNYVPTLGSIIGVIPPTVFALVQFGGYDMALLVFAVVGGIQIVMGNYVDPLVQGKYMSLSAAVVLLSVTFWGFIWGPAGALIGVPMTVLTVLICREFASTRWIAALLAGKSALETGTGEPIETADEGRTLEQPRNRRASAAQ